MTLIDPRPNATPATSDGEVGISYDAKRRRVAVDAAAVGVIGGALKRAGVTMEFPPAGTPVWHGITLLSYLAVYDVMEKLRGRDYRPTSLEAPYLNRLSSSAGRISAAAVAAAATEGSGVRLPDNPDEDSMVLFYDDFSQQVVPDLLKD